MSIFLYWIREECCVFSDSIKCHFSVQHANALFQRPNLEILSSLIYWACFNQDCFAMQSNHFKEDLSLGSLSLWHCVSVEEILIYAHTAGHFLHCNSFTVIGLLLASLWIGQDLGEKKGKSKIRHHHGTNGTMTKDTQVHKGAGMNANSRESARVTQH